MVARGDSLDEVVYSDEELKANAVAEYKFVWQTLPDDSETKAMTLNRAKALGATAEELAL